MPAVTRELEITYGESPGIVLGGSTDRLIKGKWRLVPYTYDRAVVECQFLVTGASEAAFVAERQAVEAGLRKPRQRLRVKLGAVTHLDLDPATNTGFNARTELQDLGEDEDTGRSRLYSLRVEVELPADLTGQNGLREAELELGFSPALVRTLTVRGVYTALAGNGARAVYDANVQAYVSSKITNELGGGTFELVRHNPTTDDTNKVCRFERVYQEVIRLQSTNALNDSEIVSPRLVINRAEIAPGDSESVTQTQTSGRTQSRKAESATRPTEFDVSFECWIDKAVTDLNGKWDAKIKPSLISFLQTYVSGRLVITDLVPGFDLYENKITATLRAFAIRAKLMSLEIETDDEIEEGHVVVPVWSGDPRAAYVFQGQATILRTITRTSRVEGKGSEPSLEIPKPSAEGFVLLSRGSRRKTRKIGISGYQAEVTDLFEVQRSRYVKRPVAGGSGGGGSTVSR